MTVSSAEPEKLEAFVDRTRPGRTSAEAEQRGAASQQSSVRGASPDYGIDAPIVTALAGRLASMHDNERFVSTIRTELLAADRQGRGPITVSDAWLRAALDAAGAATPPPRLRFEPTSIYGLPPTSGFVDDPVCAANGNMIHQDVDLVFPGAAASLDLVRTYNSLLTERIGAFGPGFASILDVRLDAFDGRVEIHLPDGATAAFVRVDDGWVSAGRRLRDLEPIDTGWVVAVDDIRSYRFDHDGRLAGWDVGASRVRVSRDSDRIDRVHEARSGRWYAIEWTDLAPAVVSRVVTSDGRWVAYARDDGQRLVRASSPAGHLDYEWADGFLVAVVDADGVRPFRNQYDAGGRVVRQTSPFGRVSEYRYDGDGLTVITDERGVRQAMVHDGRGNLTAVVDVDGSAMRLAYDHLDRVVGVTDRTGATWSYRFDPDDTVDRLVERVDPDGLSERWEWDAAGRVTRHTDRSGAVTSFEYRGALRSPVRTVAPDGEVTTAEIDDRFDLPISITDGDGVIIRFEHDADGQPTAAVDAMGGRTTFEFDPAGRLAAYRDAVGAATTITHDRGGRVVAHDRAGAITTYTRSAAGRVIGGTEPGDVVWSATFGVHGAPVDVTDALGATLRFGYDAMGNVTEVVAPDGATYRHDYDEVGRLVAVVDPAGGVTRQRYDGAGNLVEIIDPAGRTARREVDVFGRTLRSIAPDGAVTEFTYHPNGEIAIVTGPDGRQWRSELDARGRLVALTNPAGGRAVLAYTPAGRLAMRRSPAGRVETFEYDAAGRRVAIVDAAGVRHAIERDGRGRMTGIAPEALGSTARIDVEWDVLGRIARYSTARTSATFEHDPAGRVLAVTDGAGARTDYRYDARGLLVGATDPAGARTDYYYDARGRLIAQTAPGGRTSAWSYDAVGCVAGGVDPAGVAMRIERDPGGFVTGMSRGSDGWRSELDPAGRQVRRTAFDGTILGEYRYDPAGRLAAASNAAGWASQFLWDDDDQLTAIVDTAGTTLIERDADGWAIAMTQPDGIRTIIDRDTSGRIVGVRDGVAGAAVIPNTSAEFDLAGRLLLGPDGTTYRYDEAGRLAEIAPRDGNTVSFEYGPDGLITTEHRVGLTRRFTYDAAGRVATITRDGGPSTRFEYDDAGRRVGELRSDGNELHYRWTGLDRLTEIVRVAPDGERSTVPIEVDALGRPRRVGAQVVDYDPLTSLPSRIGDVRVVNLPGLAWRSDDAAWGRSRPGTPEGLTVGALTFLGVRVLDQASRQFLTPDPLLTVPGSNGAASAYTYAWNDPVTFVDPTGMRPISREDWNAIREREEQGRLGQAWQAIHDDPWGSLAAGAVIVTGAVLCSTLVPVGVGILIGAGVSAGAGFATGTLDPRQVALSGVLGGISGGAGAASLSATESIALGVGMGGVGDFGAQLIQGGPIGWQSLAVNGVVGGLTGGIGYRLGANQTTTAARSALAGGVTEGGGSVVRQALTGDHTVDLGQVAFDAAGGAGSGVAGHHFSPEVPPPPRELLELPAPPQRLAVPPGPGPVMVTAYRRTDHVAELQIHQETGFILSDVARRAYVGTEGDLDIPLRLPTSNESEPLAPHSIPIEAVGN